MQIMKSVNILCLGDSLTAGYSQAGTVHHPYGMALQSSLEKALPLLNITVDVRGLDGDQVISPPGFFLPRMNILYEEVHPKTPYDYAIILGGTNDLGHDRLAEDIYTSLQKVWSIPLQHHSTVVSLTVPQCSICGPPTVAPRRDALNKMIMNHKAENFYTFDLEHAVPYFDMPEDERKNIWDDPVHFTAKGYDLVGSLVANRLLELMGANQATNTHEKGMKVELKK